MATNGSYNASMPSRNFSWGTGGMYYNGPTYVTTSWNSTSNVGSNSSSVTVSVKLSNNILSGWNSTRVKTYVKLDIYVNGSQSASHTYTHAYDYVTNGSTFLTKTFTINHDSSGDAKIRIKTYGYCYIDATNPTYGNCGQVFTNDKTWSIDRIEGGVVYIDNGNSFEGYRIYIDNGTSFDAYAPYIDDGEKWVLLT